MESIECQSLQFLLIRFYNNDSQFIQNDIRATRLLGFSMAGFEVFFLMSKMNLEKNISFVVQLRSFMSDQKVMVNKKQCFCFH